MVKYMKDKIIKALKFFGISGIGWILDIITFSSLNSFFHINIIVANIFSSFIAITFVFLSSTRKLFQNNSKISLKYKYIIYLLYQIVIVLCSSFIINSVNDFILGLNLEFLASYTNIVAKIIVTPFTMIINYIAMTIIVEKL